MVARDLPGRSAMARARDARWLNDGGGDRISVYRRAQLDGAADTYRSDPRVDRGALDRGQGARSDAVWLELRGGERGVSRRSCRRDRHAAATRRKSAQLF